MNKFAAAFVILGMMLMTEDAYMARFPNLVQERLPIPLNFQEALKKVLGVSSSEHGKTLFCSLVENMQTAFVVAQKGVFDSAKDARPMLKNEFVIDRNGNVSTVGPYWLDRPTGFPSMAGPQYYFTSPPFDDSSTDLSNCWVRMNQFLRKSEKDVFTLKEPVSTVGRLFLKKPQAFQISRFSSEGKTILVFALGVWMDSISPSNPNSE